MTTYSTCRGCRTDRVSCPRLNEIKAGMRGLAISSVKFKCADRQPLFGIGQRVIVTWPMGDDGYGDMHNAEFCATVIREMKPGRYLIKVDEGESHDGDYSSDDLKSKSGFANVSGTRLRDNAAEPERRAVCATCMSLAPVPDETCSWGGVIKPAGCIRDERPERKWMF